MRALYVSLISSILVFVVMETKGQVLYQDEFVRIKGYMCEFDNFLFFQIENISDSVLILNEKNINFEKIRENEWAADLSLMTSDLSLLQPSFGHFLSFKRLMPKMKYLAVAYDFPSIKRVDLFKLFIQIDYLPIPYELFLFDNMLYGNFVEIVNDMKLKVNTFKGELMINKDDLNNDCNFFQLQAPQ